MSACSLRKTLIVSAIATSAFLFGAGGGAYAQNATPGAASGGDAPTPRTADGHPDLTGVWQPARLGPPGGGNTPLTQIAGPRIGLDQGTVGGGPETAVGGFVESEMGARDGSVVHLEQDATQMMRANPNKPWYKPEYWDKVRELDQTGTRTSIDPGFGCHNPGLPRIGAPSEIVQQAKKVILLYRIGYGAGLLLREVPTDGRALPKPADYEGIKPMGISSGHWDGDTLVIETVDPTPGWLGETGWFYSPEVKFTEKLRRSADSMTYDITVEDTVLLRPWVLPTRKLALDADPNAILTEPDVCAERDAEHIVGEGEHPGQKN